MSIGPLETLATRADLFNVRKALEGCDAVIHLAGWSGARAGVTSADYVDAVNVAATERLARLAVEAGIRHFVFMSSIKAVASSSRGEPLTATTPPRPSDAYGRSKLQAEQALLANSKLAVTIIRPPLVYGPGMKGSLLALFKAAQLGVPLPLASIKNARDFLGRDSLDDLVCRCVAAPAGTPRILLACDGEPVSSAGLYRRIGTALGKPARSFPFPSRLLRTAAQATGRGAMADSLLSSLRIDDTATRAALGWRPVLDLQVGLDATGAWYRSRSGAQGA